MSSCADACVSLVDSVDGKDLLSCLRPKPVPLPVPFSDLSVLIQHRITFQEGSGRTRAKFVAAFKKTFPTALFAPDVNELWTAVLKTDSIFNLGVIQTYCNFVEQHGVGVDFHRCEIQNRLVPL
jgi:hypothetical protein